MTLDEGNAQITESYRHYQPPFAISPVITRLISPLRPEYGSELPPIVLTESGGAGDIPVYGRYHSGDTLESSWIELLVDVILKPWPAFLLQFSVWQDLAFAGILYHEIGHHIQLVHSKGRRSPEHVALKWEKNLVNAYFAAEYSRLALVFRPICHIVALFQRIRRCFSQRCSAVLQAIETDLSEGQIDGATHKTEMCMLHHADELSQKQRLQARFSSLCLRLVDLLVSAERYAVVESMMLSLKDMAGMIDTGTVQYYLALCEFRTGRYAEGRTRIQTSLVGATDGNAALMIQLLGESSLIAGEYETALRAYEEGWKHFESQPDTDDLVAGFLLYASESAYGAGQEDVSKQLIDRLKALDDSPQWALEKAQDYETGRQGLRHDAEFWKNVVPAGS